MPASRRGNAVRIEHDRARAIRHALRCRGDGDVVLIAGKGHEDYQIYGDERRAVQRSGRGRGAHSASAAEAQA